MGKREIDSKTPLLTAQFFRILFIHFLAMGSVGIYFFLPRFIRLTGGEEFLIGLIMGAPSFAAIIFRLPTGIWIDRLGRKRLVIVGLLFFSIASALPVFAQKAGIYLLVVRAAAGGAVVIYFTAIITYVAEKAPEGRLSECISVYGASGFIALALSPYLCEWLLEVLPVEPLNRYRILFILAALFSGVALAAALGLSEDELHGEKHLDPDPWYRVVRSPTMIYLVIPSVVFGIGYSSIFNFIADFTQIQDLGSPSNFFISYSVTVIVLRLTTGHLLDSVDRRFVVLGALVIITAGLFYASMCSGTTGLVIVGILTGTGHGYIFPSLSSLTYDSSPPRNRGTSMSLYMLGFDLSMMVTSPVLGRIAQAWDYFTMYRVSSFLLLAGGLVYLTGWRYHGPAALRWSARRAGERDELSKAAGALP